MLDNSGEIFYLTIRNFTIRIFIPIFKCRPLRPMLKSEHFLYTYTQTYMHAFK